ncbi:Uncharacterized WD repeat-containing protein alr3466 [Durusdinium trenchii]|uniref:Uncharacterized WD repeat-containing protein alr3466 n=1 Tax=Durusdinium trenchii TaxID=1381693 RepID=A0ABP0RKY6_9DINO
MLGGWRRVAGGGTKGAAAEEARETPRGEGAEEREGKGPRRSGTGAGNAAATMLNSLGAGLTTLRKSVTAAMQGVRQLDVDLLALEDAVFPDGKGKPGGPDWQVATGQRTEGKRRYEDDQRVLRGAIDSEEQVRRPSLVVKVFVSSTFSDTRFERDAFMAFAVPHLRKVCRAKGLDFELSEMRWGINNRLSESQETMSVCLAELERCIRESAGICVVGILGNKLGFRPFPSEIEKTLFERLLERVEDVAARELLSKWYKLDTNALPSVFVLLPVTALIPDYNPHVQNQHFLAWWEDNFEPMQRALRSAAALVAGELKNPMIEFSVSQSATEAELRRAFRPGNETLLLVREFSNLSEVDDPAFMDREQDDAQERLDLLKETVAERASKTISFDVPWDPTDGFDPVKHPDTQGAYLREMIGAWTHHIEESIARVPVEVPSEVFDEVRDHLGFAVRRASEFSGVSAVVRTLTDFLSPTPSDGDDDAGRAIILSGVSGVGKTSVLSKAVRERLDVGNDQASVMCVRFCGTTSRSSDQVELLGSIAAQVLQLYGGNHDIELKTDFAELCAQFRLQILLLATEAQPLVLVLDALDQLVSQDTDQQPVSFDWLPAVLPPFVRVVVSCVASSPTHTALLNGRYLRGAQEFQVAPLQLDDVADVLEDCMPATRRLSEEQQLVVMDVLTGFEEPPTHLALQILANEMLRIRSFSPVPTWWVNRIRTTQDAIDVMLERLEAEHGEIFVSRALGLVTAARDGLTPSELEDLLSMDNDVLRESFEWWVQPLGRVPPLQVTRLVTDLEAFLVGSPRTWFHAQFQQACNRRYVGIHSFAALAAYFGDNQGCKALTLRVQTQRVRIGPNRRVQPQPLELVRAKTFNTRKLRELPRALIRAGRAQDALKVLQDASFCRAMVAAKFTQELLALLRARELPDQDARHVQARALTLSLRALIRDPDELASQMLGRISESKQHMLLKSIDAQGQDATWRPWLRPLQATLTNARDPLLRVLFHQEGELNSALFSSDGSTIVTAATDKCVRLWDAASGVLKAKLQGHDEPVLCAVANADASMVVSGGEDCSLRVWHLSGSGQEGEVVLQGDEPVTCVALCGPDLVASGSYDGVIRLWSIEQGKCVRELQGHTESVRDLAVDKHNLLVSGAADTVVRVWPLEEDTDAEELILRGHKEGVQSVAIASDASVCASGSEDGTVRVWKLQTGALISTLGDPRFPNPHPRFWVTGVEITPDGKTVVCSVHTRVQVWNVKKGAVVRELRGHSNPVRSVGLSPCGGQLVSASEDLTARVWDLSTALTSTQSDSQAHSAMVGEVAIAPNGEFAVSGSWDRTLRIWDLANEGRLLVVLPGHNREVRSVAITPDSTTILSGSGDKTVCVWNVSSRRQVHIVAGHTGAVTKVAVFPDGQRFVSASHDNTLRVHRLSDGMVNKVLKGHSWWVRDVSISADGTRVVSGSEDTTARIWDPLSGAVLHVLEGHSGAVRCVGVQQDVVITGSLDKTVRTWDLGTGQPRQTFEGHQAAVRSLQVGVGGDPFIVTRDVSGASLAWDVARGMQLDASGAAAQALSASNLVITLEQRAWLPGDTTGFTTDHFIESIACDRHRVVVSAAEAVHILARLTTT